MSVIKNIDVQQFQKECLILKSKIKLNASSTLDKYAIFTPTEVLLNVQPRCYEEGDELNLSKGDFLVTADGFMFVYGADNNLIKKRASLLITLEQYKKELGLVDDFILYFNQYNRDELQRKSLKLLHSATSTEEILKALYDYATKYWARSLASRTPKNGSCSIATITHILDHPDFNTYFKYWLDLMIKYEKNIIIDHLDVIQNIACSIEPNSLYPINNLEVNGNFYTYW